MSFKNLLYVSVVITMLSQTSLCDENSSIGLTLDDIESTLDDIELTLETLTTSFSDNPDNLIVVPELLTSTKARREFEFLLTTINWLLSKLEQSATSRSIDANVSHYDVLQYIMFSLIMVLFILKFIKKVGIWYNNRW